MVKAKKTTIKDVATFAGVSTTTVSMVINGKTVGIPDATRERVLRAATELKYHINYNARAMVTRKTNIIGVIIPDISNLFFAECVRHIQVELAKCGYDIILCNSEEKSENDMRYIRLLAGRNVDGLIVTPSAEALTESAEEEIRGLLAGIGVPYLFLDRYYRGDEPKVLVDNLESSYCAAKHLIENGHRKIGAVTGPLTLNSSYNRLKGLMRAMEEHGIPFDKNLIYEGKYDIETGIRGGEKLMKTDITAIFAFSDMQAYGVYESAKQAGRRIPDDLSIVGFDDSLYSTLLDAPLTTMRQPVKELAQKACSKMLSLIAGESEGEDVRIPAQLIKRGSVKNIG